MKKLLKKNGLVVCNAGAWDAFNKTLKKLKPTKVFVITDTHTLKYCKPLFLKNYSFTKTTEFLEFPAGELHKNIDTCLELWNQLSNKGADRNSLIINLGGGVVTDLGGFVASTFKRGLTFINIPTTLLAMVDASVGGKNGVDLGLIKNQIGVINTPNLVLIDTRFLKTLPNQQITSGYAEMLKHGLIHSLAYWQQVKVLDETNIETIEDCLWESVQFKNTVVTKDPYEQNLRKTLNYGHTLGHAIESYSLSKNTLQPLLHGEAIAIGMILANYLSSELVGFPTTTLEAVNTVIIKKFPKVFFNNEAIQEIISLLVYDKKNTDGKVMFVLLKDIGVHKINCEVPNSLIKDAFEYYKNL